jgi:ABC-type sugar transport system permease subunit
MKKRGKLISYQQQRKLTGLIFIAPFVAGFLFFYVRSLVMNIQFSLSDISLSDTGYALKYVGLKNFIAAFRDEIAFPQVLTQSFLNMFIDILLIIFFSLFIAVLLNQKFKGRSLARAIFFLPVILNSEAISRSLSTAAQYLLGGGGPSSAAMDAASSSGVNVAYYLNMLSDLAIPAVMINYIVDVVGRISGVITSSGVQIVIFLAALQSISPSLYEVARIEGATGYETFWKVTFPMVSPLIVTNFVFTAVNAFIESPVVQLSYDTIFGYRNDYAMGTVFSLISLAIVSVFLAVVGAILSKLAYYQN